MTTRTVDAIDELNRLHAENRELDDLARELLRALVVARTEAERALGCIVAWEDQAVIRKARKVLNK